MPSTAIDYPTLLFNSPALWRDWLEKNHQQSSGVWLRFYKKNSQKVSVVYAEALEEALCYGWIDSQTKSYIERLIKEGKMKPAGMLQVEEAKKDGRWTAAYDSPSTTTAPDEFLQMLKKNKKAQAFYKTLNKTNTYAIIWRIKTAKKEETKLRRMKAIIEMLEKEEKIY